LMVIVEVATPLATTLDVPEMVVKYKDAGAITSALGALLT
jgi:hypothetical protein